MANETSVNEGNSFQKLEYLLTPPSFHFELEIADACSASRKDNISKYAYKFY